MEKQVTLNIHGYPVICNLFISGRTARRFTFSGGQINMQVKEGTSLLYIQNYIEKILSERIVRKLNSSPYIGEDYVDYLGERKRLVVLNEGMDASSITDIIIRKREDLPALLKKSLLDIITAQVRKYEKLMQIPVQYEIKITDMRSCLGKNYFRKGLLTFDKDLVHYSLEIIDSVVIHELCHYFYQNHSKNFYDKLLYYCPSYKLLREKLMYGERK